MSTLRTMYMSDLPTVLKIIAATDEEDAEAAEAEFHDDGLDNQYVLEVEGKVVGISGFRLVPGTDATYWLNWTYLAPEYHGKGLGRILLEQTLRHLRELEARMVFVKVSDYVDDEEQRVYESAHAVYEKMGFEPALIGHDFYDDGENQHIMRLSYSQVEASEGEGYVVADEKPVIRFNGLHEIAETDGAYTFRWTVEESTKLFGKRSFSEQDLKIGLESVKNDGGRKVFLTFPSNLPLIHKPLQAVGFKYVGQLTDYYERGVHELHFVHHLNGV